MLVDILYGKTNRGGQCSGIFGNLQRRFCGKNIKQILFVHTQKPMTKCLSVKFKVFCRSMCNDIKSIREWCRVLFISVSWRRVSLFASVLHHKEWETTSANWHCALFPGECLFGDLFNKLPCKARRALLFARLIRRLEQETWCVLLFKVLCCAAVSVLPSAPSQ